MSERVIPVAHMTWVAATCGVASGSVGVCGGYQHARLYVLYRQRKAVHDPEKVFKTTGNNGAEVK